MKIAFFTYPAAFQNVGGGEILLLKMREALQKQGVAVDLFDPWAGRVENYDLIHVFGSVKDCLGLVRVARSRKVKVAITPLLWSDWRRAMFSDGSLSSKADFMARHLAKVFFPAFPSKRRELLLNSDLVFPNSEIEKKHIARLFAIPEKKMRVVYNGVDPAFQDADPLLFKKTYGDQAFILGVGRIEPRKNQLNLIKAVKGIAGARLILIGSPVSGYEGYFDRCRKTGEGFTVFIPTLKHEDPLLKSAYAACALFVLQGWFETPGLVAMEAALGGAKVLVTQGGSTREYFEDTVEYLDPSRPLDIQKKITETLTEPGSTALKTRILKNFTWDKVARDTREFYKEALKQ